jgi:two-component system response regulator (stage 0 sporulation protein F)
MKLKKNLLYVDDEQINLMLFQQAFKDEYDITTAISGNEGLDILRLHPEIEIVISDMKMPKMNGIEFITLAKSEFKVKLFIILTGFDITNEIETALKSKLICEYFSKPFKKKDIVTAINQILNTESF